MLNRNIKMNPTKQAQTFKDIYYIVVLMLMIQLCTVWKLTGRQEDQLKTKFTAKMIKKIYQAPLYSPTKKCTSHDLKKRVFSDETHLFVHVYKSNIIRRTNY